MKKVLKNTFVDSVLSKSIALASSTAVVLCLMLFSTENISAQQYLPNANAANGNYTDAQEIRDAIESNDVDLKSILSVDMQTAITKARSAYSSIDESGHDDSHWKHEFYIAFVTEVEKGNSTMESFMHAQSVLINKASQNGNVPADVIANVVETFAEALQ